MNRAFSSRLLYIILALIAEEALGFSVWRPSFYSSIRHATDPSESVEWPFSPVDGSTTTEKELEEESGDVQIPSTGISVSDEMDAAQKDRFVTEVVPVKGLKGVAQLVTTPIVRGSFEPVRYLISLSPPRKGSTNTFVLVDVPPYSPQLVTRMKAFMGKDSALAAILVTNRDAIHHDEAPSIFSTRRADLADWKQAFSELEIVAYRLDIPRDCRDSVTQVLDGYGPFAIQDGPTSNCTFVETGRPLTVEAWDHDVAEDILSGRRAPDSAEADVEKNMEDEIDYSPRGIRAREDGKRILAVYTPGHTFGSMSYVFPEQGLCCSGYAIPVEDTRTEENFGMEGTGPALDCRGYITTSRAGISRQMGSAKKLVETYGDRFTVVMPNRGDPLFLDGTVEEREEVLVGILDQYKKIGEIYEQLGITGEDDDGEDEEF